MKKVLLYLLLSLTVVSCKKEKIKEKEKEEITTPVAHPAEHTGTGKWTMNKVTVEVTQGTTTQTHEVLDLGYVQFKADGTMVIYNQIENIGTDYTYSINSERTQLTLTTIGGTVTHDATLVWTTPNQMKFTIEVSNEKQIVECTRQ